MPEQGLSRRRVLFGAALAGLAPGGDAQALPEKTQAVSSDGLWRLTAEPLNRALLLQDALGMSVRRYAWPSLLSGLAAQTLLTPVHIADHPLRRSFVVAFGGATVLWEMAYHPQADPIYDGLVHDYRLGEGLARPGFLGIRRIRLEQPLDDFWVDPQSPHVLGRARWGQGEVQVVNLDIRRLRASIAVPPGYRLSTAQRLPGPGGRVLRLAAPDGALPVAVCLSLTDWRLVPCAEGPTAP